MKKSIILAFAAFVFALNVYGVEFKRAQTFEEAHDAVCRVTVSGARGTAFFFGTYGGRAYFMTNCHVVENNTAATLDFWNDKGRQTINARVEWRANDGSLPADFSYMLVNVDDLATINPPWLALGGRDARPTVGARIISCGAPDGRFTQSWKGQVLEYYNGATAIFSPPPVPGQSGSPICEYIDGELFVTGILTWLIGEKGRDDSKGGAIPISNLYKALERRGTNVDYHGQDASPIPPNATECAETTAQAPCVLEFTQENCAPCVDAKKDVLTLKGMGARVYVYDVATERGAEYAKRYNVKKTPCWVILGENFAPIETIEGAGKYVEIWAVLERLEREKKSKAETPAEIVDEIVGIEETKPAPAPLNLPDLAPLVEATRDFRTRPAVYEAPGDVGIFDEADRRWKNRGNRDGGGLFGRETPREKPDDGKVEGDDEPAEIPPASKDKQRPKIGEKITGGAVDAIAAQIEKRIDGKIETMKDKAAAYWDAVKYRLLMAFMLVVAVGVIVGEGVVVGLRLLWRKARAKAAQIRAAIELLKTEKK